MEATRGAAQPAYSSSRYVSPARGGPHTSLHPLLRFSGSIGILREWYLKHGLLLPIIALTDPSIKLGPVPIPHLRVARLASPLPSSSSPAYRGYDNLQDQSQSQTQIYIPSPYESTKTHLVVRG